MNVTIAFFCGISIMVICALKHNDVKATKNRSTSIELITKLTLCAFSSHDSTCSCGFFYTHTCTCSARSSEASRFVCAFLLGELLNGHNDPNLLLFYFLLVKSLLFCLPELVPLVHKLDPLHLPFKE